VVYGNREVSARDRSGEEEQVLFVLQPVAYGLLVAESQISLLGTLYRP
jgi:hypothetical protein